MPVFLVVPVGVRKALRFLGLLKHRTRTRTLTAQKQADVQHKKHAGVQNHADVHHKNTQTYSTKTRRRAAQNTRTYNIQCDEGHDTFRIASSSSPRVTPYHPRMGVHLVYTIILAGLLLS